MVVGATVQNHVEYQCARTRPLANVFRKRKLVQMGGLHAVSKKAARPSTLRCGCTYPWTPCAVCTGRTDPTHPRDLSECMSKRERIALLDPGFHPAISVSEGERHFTIVVDFKEIFFYILGVPAKLYSNICVFCRCVCRFALGGNNENSGMAAKKYQNKYEITKSVKQRF